MTPRPCGPPRWMQQRRRPYGPTHRPFRRCPLGTRPRGHAVVVFAHGSSFNASRSGFSCGCLNCNASRVSAKPDCSCPVATRTCRDGHPKRMKGNAQTSARVSAFSSRCVRSGALRITSYILVCRRCLRQNPSPMQMAAIHQVSSGLPGVPWAAEDMGGVDRAANSPMSLSMTGARMTA